MSKATIHNGSSVRVIQFASPALISALLEKSGVSFDMPCGGNQACKKCKVKAVGNLSAPSIFEKKSLSPEEIADGIRFACVSIATGDIDIYIGNTDSEIIVTSGEFSSVPLKPFGKKFGIAADIGTTTIAMYLFDLSSGLLLGTASRKNPQVAFGSDVVTRLEKALNGSLNSLSGAICSCLLEMLSELCSRFSVDLKAVDSAVIAGNTAMMYLLCNKSPESIAYAPFEQDCFFGEFISGREIELPIASVYLVRCISAYIGGDITAVLIASDFNPATFSGAPRLVADIGTNGEIALLNRGKLICCSAAAGPAFEGGNIQFGMTAKDGAVSAVKILNGEFDYDVIGGCKPVGICGSGIISAVAALLDAGIIDETGRIISDCHEFTDYYCAFDGQAAFRLPHTDILITQKDIRSLQLAKAAVAAAISTLLQVSGVDYDDIGEFIIAGGFGSYIDISCAVKIGLISPLLASHTRCVGNAAGAGASMLLRNTDCISLSEQIAKSAETVDLNADPSFFDTYIDAMSF